MNPGEVETNPFAFELLIFVVEVVEASDNASIFNPSTAFLHSRQACQAKKNVCVEHNTRGISKA